MTIQQAMDAQGLSRYQLAQASGIPWETVSAICSGALPLNLCDQPTLTQLAQALGLTPAEARHLQAAPAPASGKPQDRAYLEVGLPESVQKAIDDLLIGEQENVLHLDCLLDELYGAINANLWGGCLTDEQARYLRAKYLWGDSEEDCDDD